MDQTSMPKDFSMDQLRAFAASPAGQQLMKMMQEKNSPALRSAAMHASRGDTESARAALSSLLSDPGIQEILKGYGGANGGF